MKKPKSDYSIQTVANALRVLEEFRDQIEIGVAELARRLGLHKNNVFRLLATLQEAGYIEQDSATERYRLGLAALDLGHSFLRSRPLLERIRPFLAELSEKTGESAHLGMLQHMEVVHVAGRAPERMLVTALRVGKHLPVHCTALGKVLIGCCQEAQRDTYCRAAVKDGLLEHTPQTILDPDKFFEQIRTVAGQGFAVDIDECEAGLSCVAAPVYDADGHVTAALSVSAPSARVPEGELLRKVLPLVVSAAERLSRELGYQTP